MLHRQTAQAIDHAIRSGLEFIAAEQLPGGGFSSYSSTSPTDFANAIVYRTTFFPSLILSALQPCVQPQSQAIQVRITNFLLRQKSRNWTFNYWDNKTLQVTQQPFPDDLDDTFCALSALCSYDKSLFDGKVMAHVAKTLIETETSTGGPYRTWLVADDAPVRWQDVDIAVNANVARFLSLHEVDLPNVSGLIERAITKNELYSPYYPSSYPLIYFIASWYHGPKRTKLKKQLLEWQVRGYWKNPHDTALAVCSLLQLGVPSKQLKPAVEYLLQSQAKDGSWPMSAFCIDPSQKGEVAYAGSSALTTALCIEALTRYSQALPATIQPKHRSQQSQPDAYGKVTKNVQKAINQLESAYLKRSAHLLLKKLLRQDADKQIVLLPWLISGMMKQEVSPLVLEQLGTASLWGWMAYRVYDDFLDDEGEPAMLPVANLCLRHLITTLSQTLPANQAFQAETHRILDKLEAANAWEVAHCRGEVNEGHLYLKKLPDYGDYWQLAERSLGHTISGLGVLYAAGFQSSDNEVQALRDFFRHYLIARQLNDDIHDWEEDLRRGHINAVGVEILKRWQKSKGHSLQIEIDLTATKQDFQIVLWESVVPETCQIVIEQVNRARKALKLLKSFDTTKLEQLAGVHENIAREALAGRDNTLKFIKTMSG